jgi:hypothetical protein
MTLTKRKVKDSHYSAHSDIFSSKRWKHLNLELFITNISHFNRINWRKQTCEGQSSIKNQISFIEHRCKDLESSAELLSTFGETLQSKSSKLSPNKSPKKPTADHADMQICPVQYYEKKVHNEAGKRLSDVILVNYSNIEAEAIVTGSK